MKSERRGRRGSQRSASRGSIGEEVQKMKYGK